MLTAIPVPIVERDPELPRLTLESPFLPDNPGDLSAGHARSLLQNQANSEALSDGEGPIRCYEGSTETDINYPNGRRHR